MKSNTSKSIIVILAYILVDVLSSVKIVKVDGHAYSITGAVADIIAPSGLVTYQLVKLSLLLVIPAVVIGIAVGWEKLFEAWGVSRGFLKGLTVGLLCCLPMAVCNLIAGSIQFSWEGVLLYAIFPGIYEELLYRGFVFGILYRYCKWGFVWAAFAAAIPFTLIHLYQSHDFASAAMVFGVTAIGSLLYSWLYTEWDFNLWVPISIHTFMNFVWVLLPIEGANTAVGNVTANIGRVLTIVLTIVLTAVYKKRQGKKCFDYKLV